MDNKFNIKYDNPLQSSNNNCIYESQIFSKPTLFKCPDCKLNDEYPEIKLSKIGNLFLLKCINNNKHEYIINSKKIFDFYPKIFVNKNSIKCPNCNQQETNNNAPFYFSIEQGTIICNLCKENQNYDNENLIKLDNLHKICLKHQKEFIGYCIEHHVHLCNDCNLSLHENCEIKNLIEIKPKEEQVNDYKNYLNEKKNLINEDKKFEEIIDLLRKKYKEYKISYMNILAFYEGIINIYEVNNNNYISIQNCNRIIEHKERIKFNFDYEKIINDFIKSDTNNNSCNNNINLIKNIYNKIENKKDKPNYDLDKNEHNPSISLENYSNILNNLVYKLNDSLIAFDECINFQMIKNKNYHNCSSCDLNTNDNLGTNKNNNNKYSKSEKQLNTNLSPCKMINKFEEEKIKSINQISNTNEENDKNKRNTDIGDKTNDYKNKLNNTGTQNINDNEFELLSGYIENKNDENKTTPKTPNQTKDDTIVENRNKEKIINTPIAINNDKKNLYQCKFHLDKIKLKYDVNSTDFCSFSLALDNNGTTKISEKLILKINNETNKNIFFVNDKKEKTKELYLIATKEILPNTYYIFKYNLKIENCKDNEIYDIYLDIYDTNNRKISTNKGHLEVKTFTKTP